MRLAADSSIIVAALTAWHEKHDAAVDALEPPLRADDLVLPVPVVIESYAVLTRLPAPFRVSPSHAYEALEATLGSSSLSGFPTRSSWAFLRTLVDRSISGGSTYDAAIVRAALQGDAAAILTFTPRHFRRFSGEIEIVDPSA